MIAIKARGHLCEKIPIRQQVARHLLRHKPVKWHIVIERLDEPIAPDPHISKSVILISIRVCVARSLHPSQRHVLAITRRRQQPVHRLFVSIKRTVIEECVQFRNRRRQAREVKAHPPKQSRLVRLLRRLQFLPFQPRQHERINPVANPRAISHLRQHWSLGRHEGPMPVILRPLRALL